MAKGKLMKFKKQKVKKNIYEDINSNSELDIINRDITQDFDEFRLKYETEEEEF